MFEKEFRPLYCTDGRPGLPIRRQVGLLMLKSLRNLSDEEVVVFWSENPGLPGADADLATRMKHRTTTVAGLIELNQANRPEIKNRETRKPNFQNFRNGNPEISNDRAPTGCEK